MLIAPPSQVVHVTLSSALDVLSAMITPAVLIMACGSLIMTTSSRLMRCVDRVHETLVQMKDLSTQAPSEHGDELHGVLIQQVENLTHRARLLQKALSQLYYALGLFVATSVAIGIIALLDLRYAWMALVLGFVAAGLLFTASALLIIESRIALASTYQEMDYVSRISRLHVPRAAAKSVVQSA